MTILEWLQYHWEALCNDASAARMAYIKGAIFCGLETSALSAVEAELWIRRIETCPGHDGQGRAWCSYCGVLTEAIDVD